MRLRILAILTGALLAGCSTFPLGTVDAINLIVGHTTSTSTSIVVTTHRPGRVRVTIDGPGILDEQTKAVRTDATWGNRGTITFTGLRPMRTYTITSGTRSGRVRTLPPRGANVPVRIGFGSCMNFRAETVTIHPDGEPRQWPAHLIWERLEDFNLDAWAFIGDRFYLPGWYEDYEGMSEGEVRDLFLEHHDSALRIDGVKERLSTTPTYVVNDDHDAGPNNVAGDFEFIDLATDVIRHTYANPPMGGSEGRGGYFKISVGPVDCFFLDDRTFRDSADRVEGRPGREHHVTTPDFASDEHGIYRAVEPLEHMHGEAQMAWLREGLLASSARVKLIISGNQMLSNIHRWEAWYMYRERDAFLAWLAEQEIPGVVFVAGDRHQGYIGVLRDAEPYPLYELTASGLGVGVYYDDEDMPESPYDIVGEGARRPHFGVVEYTPADGGSVILRLEGEAGPLRALRIPLERLQ
jgi:alkaline phosphatase D